MTTPTLPPLRNPRIAFFQAQDGRKAGTSIIEVGDMIEVYDRGDGLYSITINGQLDQLAYDAFSINRMAGQVMIKPEADLEGNSFPGKEEKETGAS